MKLKYKIDVTKIEKKYLFDGKKGKYLSGLFVSNKDGKSKWGDDGFIVQDAPKEARENGERGPIIGNWRYLEPATQPERQTERQPEQAYADLDEEIPF